jgi:hypothetical protein
MMNRYARLTTLGLRTHGMARTLAVGAAAVLAVGLTSSAGAAATGGSATGSHAARAGVLAGTWRLLPAAPISTAPTLTTSVWTGREMIIHGLRYSGTGFRSRFTLGYSPSTRTWTRLARGPKPWTNDGGDVAVWTGSQMLVFGQTSAAYTPASNTWRPIAHRGNPSQIAGWTGHEAIVWPGSFSETTSRCPSAYDPVTNTWHALRCAPLQARHDAEGVWTGRELIVAGGDRLNPGAPPTIFRNAAAYNPATNRWRLLPPMPRREEGATAVWDGREVLFLGGVRAGTSQPAARGLAFNPVTNRWRVLPAMAYPRSGFAAVWTGRHVLIWGGLTAAGIIPPHGEAYNPASNRWTALPAAPLHGRIVTTAAWTGHQMIIWGGVLPGTSTPVRFRDGAGFTPRRP